MSQPVHLSPTLLPTEQQNINEYYSFSEDRRRLYGYSICLVISKEENT